MGFLTIFYCHRTSLCLVGDNTKFTDFNTHCCPKIRLRGWQKASHFTPVIGCNRSNKKNIIPRLLKFAGYIHNHKILPGNIFGLILKNKMAARDVYST